MKQDCFFDKLGLLKQMYLYVQKQRSQAVFSEWMTTNNPGMIIIKLIYNSLLHCCMKRKGDLVVQYIDRKVANSIRGYSFVYGLMRLSRLLPRVLLLTISRGEKNLNRNESEK